MQEHVAAVQRLRALISDLVVLLLIPTILGQAKTSEATLLDALLPS